MSSGEPFDQSAVAAIGSDQSDLVEELGGAKVEGTESFPTSLLSLAVDVGGKNLHLEALFHGLLAFCQQNGKGISLFTCGTPRRPDTDHSRSRLAGKEFRDDLVFDRFKAFRPGRTGSHR